MAKLQPDALRLFKTLYDKCDHDKRKLRKLIMDNTPAKAFKTFDLEGEDYKSNGKYYRALQTFKSDWKGEGVLENRVDQYLIQPAAAVPGNRVFFTKTTFSVLALFVAIIGAASFWGMSEGGRSSLEFPHERESASASGYAKDGDSLSSDAPAPQTTPPLPTKAAKKSITSSPTPTFISMEDGDSLSNDVILEDGDSLSNDIIEDGDSLSNDVTSDGTNQEACLTNDHFAVCLADVSNSSNALFSPTLHRTLQNEQAHSKTNAEGFSSQQDDLKAEIAEKDDTNTIARLKSALKASKEEKKEMEEHLTEKIEALQNEQAHSKTNAEEFQDDLKAEIAEKDDTIARLKSALKASKEEKKEMEERLAEKIESLQNEQAHSKTNAEEFQDDLKAQIAEKEDAISELTKYNHLWNVCFSLIVLFLVLALWMLRKERSKISTLAEGFSKAGRELVINLKTRRTRVGVEATKTIAEDPAEEEEEAEEEGTKERALL